MQQPPGWGPPPGHPQHGHPPHPQQYHQVPHGPPPGMVPAPPPKPPWYHEASVVLMATFCCLPLGIGLLWTSPAFTKSSKTGWTIIAGLLVMTGAFLALAPSSPRGTKAAAPVASAASTSSAPPRQRVRVDWSGELAPAISRVGGRVVIDLKVRNVDSQTLESFAILCHGCGGDEFQTIEVPAASVEKLFGNATYKYTLALRPGSELTPRIILSPNQAGNHEVRLTLRGNATAEPQSEAGGFPVITFNASVMN